MACVKCIPFGGLWRRMPGGDLARCDCADGLRLSEKPVAHKPVLTSKQSDAFVEMLAAVPFFPADSGTRVAIGDELRAMCAGPVEALWLVTRMRRLYRKWPGPIDMRLVYCSKFLPWDAEQPTKASEVYPDGIPSERESVQRALPAPTVRQIGPASNDAELNDAVVKAASGMKRLPAAVQTGSAFEKTLLEITAPPQDRPALPASTPQVLTQEDADREVARLREARAKGERMPWGEM